MKRLVPFIFIIFPLCVGCHSKTKSIKFYQFSIEVPVNWQPVKAQGIDSYVGLIAIDKKDTLSFDLGWYSNKLIEDEKYLVDSNKVYILNKKKRTPNDNDYVYYGLSDTIKRDIFTQNRISWIIIDSKKVKLVQPKVPGKGTTGIYIDSLWQAGSDVDRFEISGYNLSPINENLFLTALKTLKFHQKD